MPNENDKPGNDFWKRTFKAVGIIVVILLGLIVVAFGLLVGVCTFGSRC